MFICSWLIMTTSLKKARISAGYKTATDAIQEFGWKPSIYRAHESGSLKYDIGTASCYAKAFGISTNYLITDEPETPVRLARKQK